MPTKNELKLLKYLEIPESCNVSVLIGNPPCYEIIVGKEGKGLIKIVKIPFSELASQLDNSLPVLLCYPRYSNDRINRRIQVNNLKILLHDIEAHSRAIEAQKLQALQAEKNKLLLLQEEYSGISMVDNPRSD